MSRSIAKLFDRLFLKMVAVGIARLEASLDLMVAESCHELQQEALRLEDAGAVATQLRVAAVRVTQSAAVGDESAELALAPPSPAAKPSKSAATSSSKRGRGRPRKCESDSISSPETSADEAQPETAQLFAEEGR
jgi:hypothetical protein